MAVRLYRRIHCVSWNAAMRMVLVVAALFACASSAIADGFRIETKVFAGDEKQKQPPVSETTTLFLDGIVYDFLNKPEQTAVFRKPVGGKPGQFILLNEQHNIQTKVPTEKVAGTMNHFRAWAAKESDPFLQFAANPEFEETYDAQTGKLKLISHLETYSVDTMPAEHPDEVAEYREFLDWYTKLNTMLSHGRLPAEPRLRLNAVMARRKVVPIKVELARAGEEPLLRGA